MKPTQPIIRDDIHRHIREREELVQQALTPCIQDARTLLMQALATAHAAIELSAPENCTIENPTLSRRATTQLMSRLANDLRGIDLLVRCGYYLQAATVTASVFEGAFTIAAIGNDESVAKQWYMHEDLKKALFQAKELPVLGLKQYGKDQAMSEYFYNVYRQLCWSKHINPVVEKRASARFRDETTFTEIGVRFDDLTVRGINFCAVHAAWFTLIGADTFYRFHGLRGRDAEIFEEILAELKTRKLELHQRSLEQWGEKNPFS